MATLGGLVGHLLAYEERRTEYTWGQHLRQIAGSLIKAYFIMVSILLAALEWNWSQPLSHLGTGVASVFGSETIRAMWNFTMRKMFGHDSLLDSDSSRPTDSFKRRHLDKDQAEHDSAGDSAVEGTRGEDSGGSTRRD